MNTRRPTIVGTALILVVLLLAVPAYSAEPTTDHASPLAANIDRIESSLVMGLETNCACLQASAAQVIRDLKAQVPDHSFSKSIIPLMRILKDENINVRVRQIAALALHEIGSGRGDFAIEREAQFSDHQQLRHLCRSLLNERVRERLALKNRENSDTLALTAAR